MNTDVDLRCAVNAAAFMANARRLPVLGTVTCGTERPRDVCGRLRSPATMPSFRRGQKPGNAGKTYPATPPSKDEILAMLDACPSNPVGRRLKATIIILWRAGLRASEALDLTARDLDPDNGTVTVQCGKGSKRRVVGMDRWAWDQLADWLEYRAERYPPGPLLPIVQGPTKGQRWSTSALRSDLRHAHACEMAREGMPIPLVSKQLGHSNIATTTTYLEGMGSGEVVAAVFARPAPTEDGA